MVVQVIPIYHFYFAKENEFNGFRIEFYEREPDNDSESYLDRNDIYRQDSVGDRLLDVKEVRLRNK